MIELPHDAKLELRRIEEIEARAHKAVTDFEKRLESIRADAKREHRDLDEKRAMLDALLSNDIRAIDLIAEAWADYELAITSARIEELRIKSRPAPSAADAIKEKGKQFRELRRTAKLNEWIVRMYERNFPWLSELRDPEAEAAFVSGPVEDQDDEKSDPVLRWVQRADYEKLPPAERNQRALDRYLKSRKSPWQLGRDYELYIGFLREKVGGVVHYQGIIDGFDDLGRDLVVDYGGDRQEIVQCKRWAQHKTIHEKHVFQLFGTVVAAQIDNPSLKVDGTFVTTTSLSDRAKAFARQLGIRVEEQIPLAEFPRIKCNISRTNGERIYHLPFDQQYDTTVIDQSSGEFFALTVAEAEAAGFRRAWRWRGE